MGALWLFRKSVLVILAVLALFLFFGCTAPVQICGDNICSSGEENVCPTDCVEPVNAVVNVSVSGAWDAQGAVYLRWYHSKNVTASLNADVVSRLGDHWFGQQSKNLYVSFNDSKSGELPITNDMKQYSINVAEPGDYYFEAISEDYGYRAVSEKITVTGSNTYYVNLNLVPSNPAVRIVAYDEQGNFAFGKGTIELYYQEIDCSYGACKENQWLYETQSFDKEQEINGLFFLYMPQSVLSQKDVRYTVVIKKEGYLDYTTQVVPYSKYQEYRTWLSKEVSSDKGDLKVTIVPGLGTTKEDLIKLEGRKAYAMSTGGKTFETIITQGVALFTDLPIDNYYVWGQNLYATTNYDYSSPIPNVSTMDLESVKVTSGLTQVEMKALLGFGVKLSVLDSKGELISSDKVYYTQTCSFRGDKNYCYDYTDNPPQLFTVNPWTMNEGFINEDIIKEVESEWSEVKLRYGDQDKWFVLAIKQGYNEIVWQFDPTSIEHNYVEDVPVGGSIFVDGSGDYKGKVMEIRFLDAIMVGQDKPFQGKFGLYYNGTLLKVVQKAPSFDLRDEFGTGFISTHANVEAVFLKLSDYAYYATVRVE